MHIGVIGEGTCSPRVAARAERVGAAVAEAGATLICGGLGGVMEAAARGAIRAGGVVVGILPGLDREDANPWVTIPVITGLGEARNVIVVRSSDAVIAIGGMYGTLSEIALALKLGRPVIALGTWRLRQPEGRHVPIITARSVADAVARALAAAEATRRSRGSRPRRP